MPLPIALQLYTVREPLKADFEGTLKQVADIGYKYVELAGLGGRSPEQVKALLDDLGLTATSAHESLDRLRDDFDGVIAQARTIGYDLVVCPILPGDMRNPAGYREAARVLSGAAAKAQAANLTLCYHNHAFEFEAADGGPHGMSILADEAKGVQFELDLYWVAKGGEDPFAWMKKLDGRMPLLHVKDMAEGPDQNFAEVGTGVLDLKGMVAAAEQHGVRYLVVEQDRNWQGDDALASARTSFGNISGWPS